MGQSGSTSHSQKWTPREKATLDLKNQRDSVKRYQKKLSLLSSTSSAAARAALARNDRPRALLALRQKKYHEALLARTDAQLSQLEQLVADVEFAVIQKDVVFGLQQGTLALKEVNREMGSVEDIQRLIEEGDEQKEFQREVEEMLRGSMSLQEEEDAEEELRELERQVAGKEEGRRQGLPEVPRGDALPAAPEGMLSPEQGEDQGKGKGKGGKGREGRQEAMPA